MTSFFKNSFVNPGTIECKYIVRSSLYNINVFKEPSSYRVHTGGVKSLINVRFFRQTEDKTT